MSEKTSSPVEFNGPPLHRKILLTHWQRFAALAWSQFKAKGRGIVVIDLVNTDSKNQPIHYYVADGDEFFSVLANEFDETDRVIQSIRMYDPHRCVLFLIVEREDKFSFYDLECKPEPPLAQRSISARRARFN